MRCSKKRYRGYLFGHISLAERLHEEKMTKLQSPNFHVSKTRLIIYNVPKLMEEKNLRQLCIDAVTSRATKQKPTIHQLKLLKDKKGKEGKKCCPHNVQTLKLCKEKLQAQKASLDDVGDLQQNHTVKPQDSLANKNRRKRKSRVEKTLKNFDSKKVCELENKAIEGTTFEKGRATKKQKRSMRSRIDGALPEKTLKGSKQQAKVAEETHRKPNYDPACKYWKAKVAEETHRELNTATTGIHLEE
ncbi:Hypothetical predicted protein [Olea europaea subsp. europaea]|uniref:Uncharacterized protein n=1 Tax=Olea europaea subsp. europaea TaxID=158383 RepID=A0A8S0T6W8_OLEEU|nr:Hypothetical predicted protein [Olea europaea subsp. europaea]